MREPIDHVEVFPAPEPTSATVRFTTDEVASLCPVTEQPDLSHVVIEYVPGEWCIESKSLKLYLWGFRDRAVFAEALAAEIAGEVMATAQPSVGHGDAHPTPARRHRGVGRRRAPRHRLSRWSRWRTTPACTWDADVCGRRLLHRVGGALLGDRLAELPTLGHHDDAAQHVAADGERHVVASATPACRAGSRR